MRACLLLVVLALIGCGKEPPSPYDGAQRGAGKEGPADPADAPPWSEGTANRLLIGKTDEEVKALIGAPDEVNLNPNTGERNMWSYNGNKWLKPPEGAGRMDPSPMTLMMRNGRVAKLIRR